MTCYIPYGMAPPSDLASDLEALKHEISARAFTVALPLGPMVTVEKICGWVWNPVDVGSSLGRGFGIVTKFTCDFVILFVLGIYSSCPPLPFLSSLSLFFLLVATFYKSH